MWLAVEGSMSTVVRLRPCHSWLVIERAMLLARVLPWSVAPWFELKWFQVVLLLLLCKSVNRSIRFLLRSM